MAELTIQDISATGLGQSSPDDDISKHNPYVEFTIGNTEHKTKSIKKAATEVSWDKDTVSFPLSAGEVLTVAVWHKRHLLSNVVIGKGQLTLAELKKNGPVSVNLTEPKSGSPAGTLNFTISGNPESEAKATSGDSHAGTAGFVGTGAEAHDEAGVKTGRAFKDSDSAVPGASTAGASTGSTSGPGASSAGASEGEKAAIGAGAAAAAGAGTAGAAASAGESHKPVDSSAAPAGAADITKPNPDPINTSDSKATSQQTYREAAKDRAASAADYTTEKLQDLKVGLVGQEGAARAEGKAAAPTSDTTGAQGTYIDSAKAGAAYLITKTQDALQYTKERVIGATSAENSPTAAGATSAPGSTDLKTTAPTTADKVEMATS